MRIDRSLLAVACVVVVGAVVLVWLTHSTPKTEVPAGARPPRAQPEHDPITTRREPIPREPPVAPLISVTAPSTPPPDLEPLLLERDPLSPDYDASLLFGATGVDAIGFFSAEPRDESWAPERETDLQRLALPRLREVDPDARMDVECHTGVCRVSVHSGKDALTQQMDAYPLTCLANTTVPIWGDSSGSGTTDPYSDFYLFFGQQTRSRDGMLSASDDRCARYRDQWLQRVLGANRGSAVNANLK